MVKVTCTSAIFAGNYNTWSWIPHSLRRELCFWMSIHYVFQSADQFTSLQLTFASNHLQPCKDFQWVQNVLLHGLLQRNISTSSSHICQSKMKCCCGSSVTLFTNYWHLHLLVTTISQQHQFLPPWIIQKHEGTQCVLQASATKEFAAQCRGFVSGCRRIILQNCDWIGQKLTCIVHIETGWEFYPSVITKLVRQTVELWEVLTSLLLRQVIFWLFRHPLIISTCVEKYEDSFRFRCWFNTI
jgi:hypothetical protein